MLHSTKAETLFHLVQKESFTFQKERQSSKLEERGEEGKSLSPWISGSRCGLDVLGTKRTSDVHSASVTFPDFKTPSQVDGDHNKSGSSPKPKADKVDVDFVLKQIVLRLGEERTAEIAEEESRQLSLLPVAEEHNLPKNIKQALAGPDADLWKSRC
ncbi:hypothetical protein PGT21_000190 [Puccinia graminis f. sp. tritici]|uniref:Uncharacterized protein n=1 Tax=Puccinia graminis f. sp. tritici TaxID=56615 RepID=A0A5B0P1R2_PUCGR|nr:hypothetical protein PGT21_000190 [Puccinia graminis f. sp. tritici]